MENCLIQMTHLRESNRDHHRSPLEEILEGEKADPQTGEGQDPEAEVEVEVLKKVWFTKGK